MLSSWSPRSCTTTVLFCMVLGYSHQWPSFPAKSTLLAFRPEVRKDRSWTVSTRGVQVKIEIAKASAPRLD